MKYVIPFVVTLVVAQLAEANSGTFPAQPFNGLQITYSVSGAQLTSSKDHPGFTTRRAIQGRLGSGTLSLSGSVKALNGYGASVLVSVSAGNRSKSANIKLKVGQSKSFAVAVPIGTTAANGQFHVQMTGHYNAGTRGLNVDGYLSMMRPVGIRDTQPKPSKVSANAALARLMQLFHRRIPRGLVSSGKLNNALSVFSDKYKEFACGGYQGKVLAMLDAIRTSNDPKERVLLKHFDYGPIQAYGGGHQAVVIYPKGSNWVSSGIVLDPWPDQRPARYAMAAWAQRFSGGSYHGIGPSSVYEDSKEYPTAGGVYHDPAASRKLSAAEKRWFQSLPPEKRAWLGRHNPDVSKKLIHFGFKRRHLKAKTVVQCPLNAYLQDSRRRRSGYPGGRAVARIPGVSFMRVRQPGGGFWTELEYAPRAGLVLVLEGTASGDAMLLSSDQMNRSSRGRAVSRHSFRVQPRGRYTLSAVNGALEGSAGLIPARPARVRDVTSPPAPDVAGRSAVGRRPVAPGPEVTLFDINNIYGVRNGPRRPTRVVLPRSARVTLIQTYHWNAGRGHPPGVVRLVDARGRVHGPFRCRGASGQGGARNVYWRCPADVVLPAGSYVVQDSHPSSWAQNAQSAGRGFVLLRGSWLP